MIQVNVINFSVSQNLRFGLIFLFLKKSNTLNVFWETGRWLPAQPYSAIVSPMYVVLQAYP